MRGGDRLPGERELAPVRYFPSHLRDALTAKMQAFSHRVMAVALCGCHRTGFSAPVVKLFADHRKAKADYLEYRREIEGIAAEFAALRATPADKGSLEGNHRHQWKRRTALVISMAHLYTNIVLLHTLRSAINCSKMGFTAAVLFTITPASPTCSVAICHLRCRYRG